MEQEKFSGEAHLVEGTADGATHEVVIDLIREGFGNKRDNHYYGRSVLESHVDDFVDAKMYVDHLDPEATAKLKGMPRKVKELGGRIVESWIDVNEAGETVIRGRAKIAQNWLWEMVENDPGLLGVSINAWGKSKAGNVQGRQARIVEGIAKVGSVDWVTEAGAGGKVVSLVEAQLEQEEAGMENQFADLSIEQLQEERPDLVEELLASLREDEGDNGATATLDTEDVVDTEVETTDVVVETPKADEDDDTEVTSKVEDESVLTDVDDEDVELDEYVQQEAERLAHEMLEEAVGAAVDVVREQFEEQFVEALADADRRIEQVEQRYRAASLIERAGFKAPTERALKEQFFDVYAEAEVDAEGETTRSADEVLKDLVESAIKEKRDELSLYSEARVTGAGETSGADVLKESRHDGARPKVSPADKDIDKILGITED